MTTLSSFQVLITNGESETLELKCATAKLRRADETLCAFLNCDGGPVLNGIGSDGRIIGQQIADTTLRDIAAMLRRSEPPAGVEMNRVDVSDGRKGSCSMLRLRGSTRRSSSRPDRTSGSARRPR